MLTHTKGLENILDAMMQLPANFRLVLVGGAGESDADQAYAQMIRQRIEQSELYDRVIVTGHAEASDVSAYLMAADAIVLPFSDGYSYRRGSLITALAHGTPVITTHAPVGIAQDPLPELEDGKHALLIPANNTAQLVSAIMHLHRDVELSYWMGRNAKALTDIFSWEHIVTQHLEFYEAMRSSPQ